MKNIMTKTMKALAVAGMTMGLALGAKADNEACTNCLTFSADKSFGILMINGLRKNPSAPAVNLEWSTDQKNWSEYKTVIFEDYLTNKNYQAVQDSRDGLYKLYLRGTNNTQFATLAQGRWANKITNTINSVARKIACSGNIETLLDWKKVAKGEHPKMDNYCFYYTFFGMSTLTTAPDLPAMNLSTYCYSTMFQNCYSLTNPPAVLPATTLAQGCYMNMFKYSTSLAKTPKIAAMNQGKNACNTMFLGTALKVPPKLRATNIVNNCYQSMLQKTKIELKTTGPGKPWKIPEAAAASAAAATKWSYNMFTNTPSETSLQMNIEAGKQYYVASATPVELTVTAVKGASKVTVVDDGDEVSGSSPYTVYQGDEVSVTYTADMGFIFPGGKTEFTTNVTMGAAAMTVTLTDDQKPQPLPQVEYLEPVYNTPGDPASGIKEWKTLSTNIYRFVMADTATLSAGWWVVDGTVSRGGVTVSGEVHLILKDGCSLTVQGNSNDAGIKVSGDGNSLAIYGQSAGTGKLNATGGYQAAGIGGGNGGAGSNITINGGAVTATGGYKSAGIGGGEYYMGSNITINAGIVMATGGARAAGIGGGGGSKGTTDITINGGTVTAAGGVDQGGFGDAIGSDASGESYTTTNITVNPLLLLKADGNNPPETVIEHASGEDIAAKLKGQRYATIVLLPTEPIASSPTSAPANATLAVYTNGVLSADGTVWSNRTAEVVYRANAGYYFANGATEITNKLDTSVNPAVNKAGEVAPTSAGTPTVQLGVVAQRYPWNGTLDIQYKTPYANASKTVTFSANGTVLGTAPGTGGFEATASFDLSSLDAFKNKSLKNVKISATIE